MLYEAGPICLTMDYKTLRFTFAAQLQGTALHHRPELLNSTFLCTCYAYNVASGHAATDHYVVSAHLDGHDMTQQNVAKLTSQTTRAQAPGALAAAAMKSILAHLDNQSHVGPCDPCHSQSSEFCTWQQTLVQERTAARFA